MLCIDCNYDHGKVDSFVKQDLISSYIYYKLLIICLKHFVL
jgi:hypothetical protein